MLERARMKMVMRQKRFSLMLILLLATTPMGLVLQGNGNSSGYIFSLLATIPGPAPGPEGGNFDIDFEPNSLNNHGEAAFVADLKVGDLNVGEGVFLSRNGQISQIVRVGEPAPGGGIFEFLELGRTPINDAGDISFAFTLSPFSFPIGVNSGVYRYSHRTRTVTPVVVPNVTPAPGGGAFIGVWFDTSLNNRGDIVFTGIVPGADIAPGPPGVDGLGLGVGVFKADKHGQIISVVSPGDPAPAAGTFDIAGVPAGSVWINDKGDIAFSAHLAGDECINPNGDQSTAINCVGGLYLKKADTGEIQSIAPRGGPAPGGGVFRAAGEPIMNNRDEIAFLGDLTPAPGATPSFGVFLFSNDNLISVARPGDPLPGGGHFVNASPQPPNRHLNNLGEVAFSALLDTDDNGDGVPDTGLYVRSNGQVRLVARTGTVIPGVGTVANLAPPTAVPGPFTATSSSAIINDRGQLFFEVTLTDGRGALLVATPHP